ncbi:MAG: 3-dehydroquinate synthase [Treponema sp.]|nr:3-dehydroquinate synthase [Treponema sp.]
MLFPQKTTELFFPDGSGFSKTDIRFFTGEADLASLYGDKDDVNLCRLFVTDENVAALPAVRIFVDRLTASPLQNDALLVLKAGEASKTIESVLAIVRTALEHNFTRSSVFIGIGGGVVSDMTGFAAAIFKRGVRVQFVPTTMLADVDAAIGGKTGCDFESYKNMIGAFYPAESIHIWPSFTKSLSDREFSSGLGEAIKTAFLFSRELLDFMASNRDALLHRDEDVLFHIISECSSAKADIVHRDFKEKGDRAFLNLGHSFGHALESVAGLGTVTHGEAVAWGIGRALDLSYALGECSGLFRDEGKALLASFGYDMSPVPTALAGSEGTAEKLLEAMKKDKKNTSSTSARVILQHYYCDSFIREVTDGDILSVLAPA